MTITLVVSKNLISHLLFNSWKSSNSRDFTEVYSLTRRHTVVCNSAERICNNRFSKCFSLFSKAHLNDSHDISAYIKWDFSAPDGYLIVWNNCTSSMAHEQNKDIKRGLGLFNSPHTPLLILFLDWSLCSDQSKPQLSYSFLFRLFQLHCCSQSIQ